MQTITMKFGGTSVGSAEAIQRVAGIVRRTWENSLHPTGSGPRRVAVVVSAMSGVTNDLIHAARAAVEGDEGEVEAALARLRQRHHETFETLGLPEAERAITLPQVDGALIELRSLCRAIAVLRELTPRGLDVISGMGERLSVPLIAAAAPSTRISCGSPRRSTCVRWTSQRLSGCSPTTSFRPTLINGHKTRVRGSASW